MSNMTIRPAYSMWPDYNRRLFEVVAALDSTFRIVEGCLDRWSLDVLDDEIRREDYGENWVHTRGSVIQRVLSHDVYHSAELNERLGTAGLPQIDLWD
jgi:hypothetical protein